MTQIVFLLNPQTILYLFSPQKPEDIVMAVKNGSWLPPQIPPARPLSAVNHNGSVLIELQPASPPCGPLPELTARQVTILQALAEGGTSRQIGARLGLSERAVAWHVNRLKERLGVQTRAQAVVRAAALGLCHINPG